ncbi:MAG: hypothetical protein HZC01_00355 [Candidatus Kerfeldbacteria bacterium]|nr:hypothetical protein [Candidatus Kerfeldbacteria bacterium]
MIALFGALIIAGLSSTPTQALVGNNAPEITSTPPLTIQADEAYGYTLAATDTNSDTLTWQLTVKPNGMTLAGNTISWNPSIVGTYNVVAEVTDGKDGYDTQVWQISVIPGVTTRVTIEPNANLSPIILGLSKQFTVSAIDAEGNATSTAGVVWSADSAIGTIGTDGLFQAERGGTGMITATLDGVSQSVSLTVVDTRDDQVSPATNANTNTAAPTNTNTTVTNTNTAGATNSSTNENANEVASNTNTETPASETPATTTDKQPCVNLVHWAIIVILLAYGLIVILYYRYERTAPTPAWWILPLLVTIIALIIYYQQICPGEYLWWPWAIVGIGVIATIYYKGKRGGDAGEDVQTKLPI